MSVRSALAGAAALVAVAVPGAAAAAAGRTAWSRPARITPAVPGDVAPPVLAVAPGGGAAVGYAVAQQEKPGSSRAYLLAAASARAAFTAPIGLSPAQDVLALAPAAGRFEAITGTAPRAFDCCSSAAVIGLRVGGTGGTGGGHRLLGRQTLVSGLGGPTVAGLVPLGAGATAVVASEDGVWAAHAGRGRFGRPRRLDGPSAAPRSLATAPGPGGGSVVAFTGTAPGPVPSKGAARLLLAEGSSRAAPGRARTLLTAPAGAEIGTVAVAARGSRRGSAVTVAWVESWYDGSGARHSQVFALDVGRRASRPVALSAPGVSADAVSLAADARGDQVAVWRSCPASWRPCTVDAVLRSAGGRWAAVRPLGAIDPMATPAVVETPAGTAIAGAIDGGRVRLLAAPRRARRFRRATLIGSAEASDLTLAAGSDGAAIAAWTAGTANEAVFAVRYAGR